MLYPSRLRIILCSVRATDRHSELNETDTLDTLGHGGLLDSASPRAFLPSFARALFNLLNMFYASLNKFDERSSWLHLSRLSSLSEHKRTEGAPRKAQRLRHAPFDARPTFHKPPLAAVLPPGPADPCSSPPSESTLYILPCSVEYSVDVVQRKYIIAQQRNMCKLGDRIKYMCAMLSDEEAEFEDKDGEDRQTARNKLDCRAYSDYIVRPCSRSPVLHVSY